MTVTRLSVLMKADLSYEAGPYDPARREAWDAFVGESRTPHFMLTRNYVEYHQERFDDMSVVVMRGDEIVGLLPASVSESHVTSHAGLTFAGLLTRPSSSIVQTGKTMRSALEFLGHRGAEKLTYRAAPGIYSLLPSEEDLYWLWSLGAALVRRDVASVVLPGYRPPLRKGRKHAISKARAGRVRIMRDRDFRGFHVLLVEVLAERHGASPTHTSEELQLLATRFPDNLKLFTARNPDGQIVSGVVIYETPLVAHAQYIATSRGGREIGAADVLIESLITQYLSDGKAFDFGISTTNSGRVINEGLAAFKEGFGARTVLYDEYEFSLDTL